MDDKTAANIEELTLRASRVQQGIDAIENQLRIGNLIATIEYNEQKLAGYIGEAKMQKRIGWFDGSVSADDLATIEEYVTPDGRVADVRARIGRMREYVSEQLGVDEILARG